MKGKVRGTFLATLFEIKERVELEIARNRLYEISEGLFFCFDTHFGTHISKTNVGSELVGDFVFYFLVM